MCYLKKRKKGECLYILNRKILYYTKEILKVFKVGSVAFVAIVAVILIKYKPQYEVLINNEKIGYVDSQNEINQYIEEIVSSDDNNKNIAFVDIENTPVLKLELVNRNIEKQEEKIKQTIAKQTKIEYTTYAISIDGKNKTYLSSKDEAQKIVDDLKKDYSEKYTNKLGIIQVYSNNYSKISAVDTKKAKTKVSKELKKAKRSYDIKVAKAKQAKIATTSSRATKVSKATNVNGIKFSVKPVSGIITSRYGGRRSPGGVGSTNHKGLDIAASNGTSIFATAGGTVEFAGNKGAYGKLVIINHGSGVKTYYAHCSSLKVSKGQKVESGSNIASVGKTGTATGYHLHFEVRVNGATVNPQKYIY